MEQVILVNEQDEEIGLMEKMEAHRKGLLHRAFSIFLFNADDELLIQQRASHKYHSPNLWSNTCCSHPRKGESIIDAGARRLHEELGMSAPLKYQLNFIYKAELGDELFEHEFDHVLVGRSNDDANPNPEEVSSWKYVGLESLLQDIERNPDSYTVWFKIILDANLKELKSWLKSD